MSGKQVFEPYIASDFSVSLVRALAKQVPLEWRGFGRKLSPAVPRALSEWEQRRLSTVRTYRRLGAETQALPTTAPAAAPGLHRKPERFLSRDELAEMSTDQVLAFFGRQSTQSTQSTTL